MHTPPLAFIVIGLPRSGTTWLANWLTTDRTLCLHDPFAMGAPETWPVDQRIRGIACTAAYLLPGWLEHYAQYTPIAVIERDPAACDASLEKLGLPGTGAFRAKFDGALGKRFRFEDLWQESSARELWGWLLPQVPFDALRWRLLKEWQVQPHWGQWMVDVHALKQFAQVCAEGA